MGRNSCKVIDMRQHLDYIDLAKGMAITLVVMGHGPFPFHAALEFFHMPLWFIIAGLTFKPTHDWGTFLLKKTNRLLVSWLTFTILGSVIFYLFDYYAFFPIWFLQSLFCALIVVNLLLSYLPSKVSILGAAILGILSYVLCHYRIEILPFNLERSLSGASFIMFGYSLKASGALTHMKEKSKLNLGLLAALLFFIFVGLYYYNSLYYDYMSVSFAGLETFKVNIMSFYAMAVVASMCIITICLILDKVNLFNWMGKNSMAILIVHIPILELLLYVLKIAGLMNIGSLPLYMCLCVMLYVCTFLLCYPCVMFFKRTIPKFTGYADLIKINSIK